MRSRQVVFFVVAALRQIVDGLTAGIRQAEHACGLIEALSGRIVSRCADDLELGVAAHVNYKRIAAGYCKTEKRRFKLGIGYVVCSYVTFYVVHRYKRNIEAHGRGFRKIKADKNGTDKSWSVGHSYCVDIAFFNTGGPDCALGKARNDLDMASGRDLGHYSAIYCMKVGLREYLICQNVSPVLDHGHGGLVTG